MDVDVDVDVALWAAWLTNAELQTPSSRQLAVTRCQGADRLAEFATVSRDVSEHPNVGDRLNY